jgi:hypothetical protein
MPLLDRAPLVLRLAPSVSLSTTGTNWLNTRLSLYTSRRDGNS